MAKHHVQFSEEEKRIILENYPNNATMADLAKYIGCSEPAILAFLKRNNIATSKTYWTPERDRYIIEHIKEPKKKIAEHFTTWLHECSITCVFTRISVLRKLGKL